MGKVELLDNREIQKNRSLIVACLVLFLFLKIPAKRGISMFAIGEEKTRVVRGKVSMPVQYKLRKKNIQGIWVGKHLLYISDETPPLRSKGSGTIFDVHIDTNNCLHVPERYEGFKTTIRGCISTIELVFEVAKNEV